MIDPIGELKTRAEILRTRLSSGDPKARARLRALHELRRADDQALAAAAIGMRYKHCLAVVAREHGFTDWEHARRVLGGDSDEADFGALLHGPEVTGMLNVWYAAYAEARAHVEALRGSGARLFLLAYRRQFVVVDGHYVEALGLNPDDDDWRAIDWDWVRPLAPAARRRLYQKRLAALREAPQ
jgi:hypothetical protein